MAEKFYPLRLYIKNRTHAIMIGAALVLNLAIWIELASEIQPQPEPIFLHYNVLFGVDLIGEWWKVYALPLGGLVIVLFNTIVGWLLYQHDKFVGFLLEAVSILCQIFLLIAAFLLVFLNV